MRNHKKMNTVHRHIKFPIDIFTHPVLDIKTLIKEYNVELNEDTLCHFRFPLSAIPNEFNDWFHKQYPDLYIKDWEVFYTPAGHQLPIHSDGFKPFIDFIKFNYVYNGDNSTMSWYELIDDSDLQADRTGINTSYTAISPENVKLIHQCNIGTPSLINAGVAHGVDNSNNEKARWCVCLIPCYRNPKEGETSRIVFQDALSIFESYIN